MSRTACQSPHAALTAADGPMSAARLLRRTSWVTDGTPLAALAGSEDVRTPQTCRSCAGARGCNMLDPQTLIITLNSTMVPGECRRRRWPGREGRPGAAGDAVWLSQASSPALPRLVLVLCSPLFLSILWGSLRRSPRVLFHLDTSVKRALCLLAVRDEVGHAQGPGGCLASSMGQFRSACRPWPCRAYASGVVPTSLDTGFN